MREGFLTLQLRHFLLLCRIFSFIYSSMPDTKNPWNKKKSLSNVKNCNILRKRRNRRNIMNNNVYSQVNVLFCVIFFAIFSFFTIMQLVRSIFSWTLGNHLKAAHQIKWEFIGENVKKKLIKTAENLTTWIFLLLLSNEK